MGRDRRRWRQEVALEVAYPHDGVAKRRDLQRRGLTADDIRTEVDSGRWHQLGRHTIGVTVREPVARARWWWAVWESGPGAVLDGVTALQAWGLERWSEERLHVSVPCPNRAHPLPGVTLHRPRRAVDVASGSLPRVRPVSALANAMRWARTERQAATVLVMAVQQRLVMGDAVLAAWYGLPRRRRALDTIVRDVCDGAESLGELDFAAECRRYGLPVPSRQVLRRGPRGRIYLDVYWEAYHLHVEIDGVHHSAGLAWLDDALRQNSVALAGDVTLRIPVLGLRLTPDLFLDQVRAALAAAGWAASRRPSEAARGRIAMHSMGHIPTSA